jgi:hypothetical protein
MLFGYLTEAGASAPLTEPTPKRSARLDSRPSVTGTCPRSPTACRMLSRQLKWACAHSAFRLGERRSGFEVVGAQVRGVWA